MQSITNPQQTRNQVSRLLMAPILWWIISLVSLGAIPAALAQESSPGDPAADSWNPPDFFKDLWRVQDDWTTYWQRARRTASHLLNAGNSGSGIAYFGATAPSNLQTEKAIAGTVYGKLPLMFESNQGQTDSQVHFISRGPGYTLFLTPNEAIFSLRTTEIAGAASAAIKTTTLQMRLVDANPRAKVSGLEALPTRVNYFRGQDPRQWRTGIATYAKVQLQEVYPGIDLLYYGNQRQLEYDFVVAPGADPDRIRLALAGSDNATRVVLADNGDLVLSTDAGEMRWHKPVIYQDIADQRRIIDGSFKRMDRSIPGDTTTDSPVEIGFTVAAYDHTQPLVIDPVLVYSTFLGGMSSDYATSIAVDNQGNAYVTGATASINFPGPTIRLPSFTKMDVFVAKFDSTGENLLFSNILSGSPEDKDDIGYGIAVDPAGVNLYVVGTTASATFPVNIGVFPAGVAYQQPLSGSTDAFMAHFNATTGVLWFSSCLGGGKDEGGTGITLDPAGNIYVTGYTSSIYPTAFPVVGNFYQPNLSGGTDAFVVQFNHFWIMAYSTYFGGSKDDKAAGIAVDSAGAIYITGSTVSTNLNTPWAFDNTLGGTGDAFVAKFDPSSSTPLIYSTYLGGSSLDKGAGIAVDSQYYAYVTGSTASSDFPVTAGVLGALPGGSGDTFVSKVHPTGNTLIASTYLGGSSLDSGAGIALAVNNSTAEIYTYVTGVTASANFPVTSGAFSKTRGGAQDAFVAMINPDFTGLLYATYLGGTNNNDSGAGIAIDLPTRVVNDGFNGFNYYGVYIAGSTAASDFPVTYSAYDTTINSSASDAFIAKIGTAPVDLRSELSCPPGTGFAGLPLACELKAYNDGTVLPPAPAPAIAFTVRVPSTVTFGTPPAGCRIVIPTTMTCDKDFLPPGLTPLTVPFTIMPSLAGSIAVTVQVAAAVNDVNAANDMFSLTIPVVTPLLLTVRAGAGAGTGTVTSNPAGINCGSTCSAAFNSNVMLTANPASGSTFAGWTPASCGNPMTLAANTTCTATFNVAPPGGSNNSLVLSGDYDGDGKADLIWLNSATGQAYGMLMNGTAISQQGQFYQESNTAWRIIHHGDFDGNGRDDLLWWNNQTGQVYAMLMNGLNIAGSAVIYHEPNTSWQIVAVGDLDGDGKDDLIWWNNSTGQVYGMLMNGTGIAQGGMLYQEVNTAWRILAARDFNADNQADLLWRNQTTGQVYLMLMNGLSIAGGAMIYHEPNLAWSIVAVGDLSGDRKNDLIWRNNQTGQVYGMLMDGPVISSQGMMYAEGNTAWQIVASGDYSGDGYADLLWRNAITGQVYEMAMSGLMVAGGAQIYQEANPHWRILATAAVSRLPLPTASHFATLSGPAGASYPPLVGESVNPATALSGPALNSGWLPPTP